jgi:isopenicillin-N epimerase
MFGLRRHFLLDPSVTFLNHGSFGATPRSVFRTYQDWQRELERQPVEFLVRRSTNLMRDARISLADYVGADAENLVYTTNVTVSLNIVAHSLSLGPGDEVLRTDHEYGALDRTWRFLEKERGFKYINQPIPVPIVGGNELTRQWFVDQLWKGVTPRTRVIFLSHITSPTALIFPIEAVIRRAHQAGVLTVVDGAHAPVKYRCDWTISAQIFMAATCTSGYVLPKVPGSYLPGRKSSICSNHLWYLGATKPKYQANQNSLTITNGPARATLLPFFLSQRR